MSSRGHIFLTILLICTFLCLLETCAVADGSVYIPMTQKDNTAEVPVSYCDANGEITFQVGWDGAITGFTGESDHIVIPEVIDGTTITSISYGAFEGGTFSSITLPDTLTRISGYAFRDCENLTQIIIPEGVTSIGFDTFESCRSLAIVSLPSTLNELGSYTFEDCASLSSIVIPKGIREIPYGCFYNCNTLKQISLPTNLVSVGGWAFHGCTSLTSVSFPNQLTYVESSAFYECSALKSITFTAPEVALDDWVFGDCISLESLNGTISSLGSYTLYNCPKLVDITLADSIIDIPQNAGVGGKKVLNIGQNCQAKEIILERGYLYRVKETGETNIIEGTFTSVDAKANAIINAVIKPGMSNYQKALALHNWLIFNADYDETYTNYYADGVLLRGKGVCNSYSLAYQLLLNKVGIPNALEYGTDHVWNMIQLDGDWYHVDVTWDDPIGGGHEGWNFFGLTNEALKGVSNHECTRKPHIATAYKYNYAYYSGQMSDDIDSVISGIEEHLELGETVFTVEPMNFEYGSHGVTGRTALLVLRDQQLTYKGKPILMQMNMNEHNDSPWTFDFSVQREDGSDYAFPACLNTIEEEAFSGSGVGILVIPSSVRSIGARAFANCSALRQITIPDTVTSIDASAFEGTLGLRIVGEIGSKAEQLASQLGILFIGIQ